MSAHCPSVHQIFCPVTSHPSPSGSALVRSDARSLPASGSLNSWHQTCSPARMRGSSVAFCSSVPKVSSAWLASITWSSGR